MGLNLHQSQGDSERSLLPRGERRYDWAATSASYLPVDPGLGRRLHSEVS